MTDDEFERIKEAEKERLREQKRLRSMLQALQRRSRAESVVERMKQSTQDLFRTHRHGVEALRSALATDEARLEVWTDAQEEAVERAEDEETLREARAEDLLRQFKAASPATNQERDENRKEEGGGPDKTIGRMNPSGSDDASAR